MGHQVNKRCKANNGTPEDIALYRKGKTSSANEFVLIVMWVHLFPSRTQKLSTCTPTIVAGRLAVKIGNANTEPPQKSGGFSLPKTCHRHVSLRQRIVAQAAKISHANIEEPSSAWFFFYIEKNAVNGD